MTTQALEALDLANSRKAQRIELRHAISVGQQPLGLVIIDPPTFAARMQVGELLCATRRIGRVRMTRICRLAGIDSAQLLCELSIADRRRLILALPDGGRAG